MTHPTDTQPDILLDRMRFEIRRSADVQAHVLIDLLEPGTLMCEPADDDGILRITSHGDLVCTIPLWRLYPIDPAHVAAGCLQSATDYPEYPGHPDNVANALRAGRYTVSEPHDTDDIWVHVIDQEDRPPTTHILFRYQCIPEWPEADYPEDPNEITRNRATHWTDNPNPDTPEGGGHDGNADD